MCCRIFVGDVDVPGWPGAEGMGTEKICEWDEYTAFTGIRLGYFEKLFVSWKAVSI